MNESFDFVMVGSGGGSLCAALVLRAAGKSVLILEKSKLVGGTTAISGGVMWIPNNRYMKSAGVKDSRDDALAYLDAVVGDRPNMKGTSRERRAAYVDNAPKMLDFLVQNGIELRRMPSWPDYYQAPGASVPGRAVVSKLFDLNRLGDWKDKLRPGFLPLPINLDEAMQMALVKRTTSAKIVGMKIGMRMTLDRLTKKRRTTAGQALQGQMLLAALKAGTQIRTEAGVKQLIVENGRVTGVVIDNNGSEQRIGAKLGVLINSGGFARNQRMLDQYIPGTSTEWTNVITDDTGEMIEEGQRIGAALAQMDERIGTHIAMPPSNRPMKPTMNNDTSKPHSIVVDQSGARYMNESGSSVEFCRKQLARQNSFTNGSIKSPAVPSWMIFDSQYIDKFMLAGTMPGANKPQPWFESKFLRKADTLEQLAADCGIDAATLRATVERFNGFARKGRDDDFQRGDSPYEQWQGDPLASGNKALGTIERGPFYAVAIYPGDVSTFGGLVTDAHGRVLKDDGSIIPGLYATGTATASVMGGVEPGPGGSIGPAFTWGYLAAKHALGTN